MARDSGLLQISANFEVNYAGFLDAKMKTSLKSDLIDITTFGAFFHKGMIVSVYDDTDENNGVYRLKTTDYTNIDNWEKLGSSSVASNHSLLTNRDDPDNHTMFTPLLDSTVSHKFTKADGTSILEIDSTNSAINLPNYFRLQSSGFDVFSNRLSVDNIAIGRGAFRFPASGSNIIAIGTNSVAGQPSSACSNVVSIGNYSLASNLNGASIVSIGHYACQYNTTGRYLTSVGSGASRFNITGERVSTFGVNAGAYTTDSDDLLSLGAYAGTTDKDSVNLTIADKSLFIGNYTKANANSETNQIVIGYSAIGKGSNTVTLGNDDILNTYLKGNVNLNILKPTIDSIDAIQITKADGITSILTVDTLNSSTTISGNLTVQYENSISNTIAYIKNLSTTVGTQVVIDNNSVSQASIINFAKEGAPLWTIGARADNNFYIKNVSATGGYGDALVVDKATLNTTFTGYTKQGSDAPATKKKKLTGITASTQGESTLIAHGLVESKILSVSVKETHVEGFSAFPEYTFTGGYLFSVSTAPTTINVRNSASNSQNILSKPFVILIEYEE